MLRQIAMQRSIIVVVACGGTSTVSGPCSCSLAMMLSRMVGERRMNGCSNRNCSSSSSYRCLHNRSENNDATRNGCSSHLNSLQSSQPSQGGSSSSSSSSSIESRFVPVDLLPSTATVHLSDLKMIATVPLPSEPRHLVRRLLRLLQTPKLSKELTSKQRKQHEQQQQQQTPTAVKTLLDSGTSSTKNGSRRWNPTQAFVLAQCRRAKQQHQQQQQEQATAETMSSSSLALLRQYTQLQADLAERARLYQLDTGVEQILSPHESSRRAAARAGLLLPITKDPFQ